MIAFCSAHGALPSFPCEICSFLSGNSTFHLVRSCEGAEVKCSKIFTTCSYIMEASPTESVNISFPATYLRMLEMQYKMALMWHLS